jgi:hypothetical protein|tara:strand:- start:404 stop:1324 length:921 start_codon:yes stop_codon:yes gene_type:complete
MPNKDYTGLDEGEQKGPREVPFQSSTLETIDLAMFSYVDKVLDLHTTTNEGWKKVPIIWVATERAYQIKHDKALRDQEGALIMPIIALHRTGIEKNPEKRGGLQPHILPDIDGKGQTIQVASRIKQDKTSNFENATANRLANNIAGTQFITRSSRRKKVIYESISMPIPVWIEVSYSIVLRTEYQQQINQLLQPFITRPGNINHFMIGANGHRFESFVQSSFGMENNIQAIEKEERRYETKVEIKVLGYLMGSGDNQNQPKVVVRENYAEFVFPRERVIMGDIPMHSGDGTITLDKNKSVDGGYKE